MKKIIIAGLVALLLVAALYSTYVPTNEIIGIENVGFDLVSDDTDIESSIISSQIINSDLIIEFINPNNEKVQIIGLGNYKIEKGEVTVDGKHKAVS